jgi:hypothetical protein
MLAAILFLAVQLGVGNFEHLNAPANLDFEEVDAAGRPVHWIVLPPDAEQYEFEVTTTDQDPSTGARSAVIRRDPGKHYGEQAVTLTQVLDAPVYRGHRVRLRAWIKRHGRAGDAILRIRQTRQGGRPAENRITLRNSTSWKQYELTVDVPADATTIEYGVMMKDGELSIDSVAFDIVDGKSF